MSYIPGLKTATQSGAILDCDLVAATKIGGGVATDNTAVLNAMAASSTPQNPSHIIIDGASVTNGIQLPGGCNATIEGTGKNTGLVLKANAFLDLITNIQFSAPDYTLASLYAPAQNLRIENLLLNGNRANNPRSANGGRESFPISLRGVNGLEIHNVKFINPALYSMDLLGCSHISIHDVEVESFGILNGDGVHIEGPTKDVRISDSHFSTGDDAIALNAAESDYEAPGGDIEGVAVTNCTFNKCLTALRAYGWVNSSRYFYLRKIAVSNCVGSVQSNSQNFITTVFLLGDNIAGSKPDDIIQDFSATSCTFESLGYIVDFGDPCGTVKLSNFTWVSPTVANPAFHFEIPVKVQNIEVRGFTFELTSVGHAAAYLLSVPNGAVINRFVIDGVSVRVRDGVTFSGLPYLIDAQTGSTINELVIDSLSPTNIVNLVNPVTGFVNIHKVSGTGVLACGFQIPDSIMADNTPYISATGANAGQPCVKMAGVVYQLLSGVSSVTLPSPIEHWPMKEGAGATFYNVVNPSNNMTASNVTFSPASGLVSPAAYFGTNGSAQAANYVHTSRATSTPFTYFFRLVIASSTSEKVLMTSNGVSGQGGIVVSIISGTITFRLIGSSGTKGVHGDGINAGNGSAHSVAITYDGSGTGLGIKIYIDGLATASNVFQDETLGDTSVAFSLLLTNSSQYLQDLRLYDVALTSQQVAKISQS